MIIKNADSKDHELEKLETLLKAADSKSKKLIANELRMMKAGIKGEQESAYYIDFRLKSSKNTAVIHDLRLNHGGRVAQIDHLLIHCSHRFYVLESKHFSHGIKINEQGEFNRWNDWQKRFEGMPSPIEQNKRHALVLKEVLESMGYKNPAIESFILISPKARIDRPRNAKLPEVVKADQFLTTLEKDLIAASSGVGGFIKLVSSAFGDSPEVIAEKLIKLHSPISIDYESKFNVQQYVENLKERHSSTTNCPRCGSDLVLRTAKSGKNAGSQFYGCAKFPACRYTAKI